MANNTPGPSTTRTKRRRISSSKQAEDEQEQELDAFEPQQPTTDDEESVMSMEGKRTVYL